MTTTRDRRARRERREYEAATRLWKGVWRRKSLRRLAGTDLLAKLVGDSLGESSSPLDRREVDEREPTTLLSCSSTSPLQASTQPVMQSLRSLTASFSRLAVAPFLRPSLPSPAFFRPSPSTSSSPFSTSSALSATLNQVTRGARKPIRRQPRTPALAGCYQKKGVCSKGGF